MKRHSLKVLSLFLPFIASSCCSQHDRCDWQEYQDNCCVDSCDCRPWSFAPKPCCNAQVVCNYQNPVMLEEPAAISQAPVEEPVVNTSVLGGQKEEKLAESAQSAEPVAFNLTQDLQENPTKYLHFIATLDEQGFLTLIVKNKGEIPLQEVTVRVSTPSLPHLSTEKVVVKFDGSVGEGANLTAQTTIGPFANFDELKDSLEVSFVGATPSN